MQKYQHIPTYAYNLKLYNQLYSIKHVHQQIYAKTISARLSRSTTDYLFLSFLAQKRVGAPDYEIVNNTHASSNTYMYKFMHTWETQDIDSVQNQSGRRNPMQKPETNYTKSRSGLELATCTPPLSWQFPLKNLQDDWGDAHRLCPIYSNHEPPIIQH